MGCKEAFPLAKKSAHERDCPFLQLKCPFHGQCAFNGSLADVVPHLASEHSVTPVPVQPAGTLFYRAKVPPSLLSLAAYIAKVPLSLLGLAAYRAKVPLSLLGLAAYRAKVPL